MRREIAQCQGVQGTRGERFCRAQRREKLQEPKPEEDAAEAESQQNDTIGGYPMGQTPYGVVTQRSHAPHPVARIRAGWRRRDAGSGVTPFGEPCGGMAGPGWPSDLGVAENGLAFHCSSLYWLATTLREA